MRTHIAAVVVAATLLLSGCNSGPADPPPPVPPAPPPPALPPPPDGEAVLAIAKDLATKPDGSTWYRTPGTADNLAQALQLRDRLAGAGFDSGLQHFNASLPLTGDTWCRNVVGEREGTMVPERSVDFRRPVIVLAAHFDSRAEADKDPDPAKQDAPVPGANDGASGVAVVLSLAEAIPATRSSLRVYFFDCEDQGDEVGGWAKGAAYAAGSQTDEEMQRIEAFILFDLVGDAELVVPREGYSDAYSARLADMAFGIAGREGLTRFENRTAAAVTDDHVPFLSRGVPALDLIHLDESADGDMFPSTHHTTFDDVDHLSADALGQVTALGYYLVHRLDQKPI